MVIVMISKDNAKYFGGRNNIVSRSSCGCKRILGYTRTVNKTSYILIVCNPDLLFIIKVAKSGSSGRLKSIELNQKPYYYFFFRTES